MYYKLDGKTPVPCTIDETFKTSIDDRRVALTWINEVKISTVFLGVDHSFHEGDDAILFETMVFNRGDGGECKRAKTWLDAQTNHIDMVNKALEK